MLTFLFWIILVLIDIFGLWLIYDAFKNDLRNLRIKDQIFIINFFLSTIIFFSYQLVICNSDGIIIIPFALIVSSVFSILPALIISLVIFIIESILVSLGYKNIFNGILYFDRKWKYLHRLPLLTRTEAQALYNHIRSGRRGWESNSFEKMKELVNCYGDLNQMVYRIILLHAGGLDIAERNYQSSDFPRLYKATIIPNFSGGYNTTLGESQERNPFINL
jgi:hypothetical protein